MNNKVLEKSIINRLILMDNLPLDIINIFFSLLCMTDKRKWIRTCRKFTKSPHQMKSIEEQNFFKQICDYKDGWLVLAFRSIQLNNTQDYEDHECVYNMMFKPDFFNNYSHKLAIEMIYDDRVNEIHKIQERKMDNYSYYIHIFICCIGIPIILLLK